MNKAIQKILILVAWIVIIVVPVSTPVDARIVKKITPKATQTTADTIPYSVAEILVLTNQVRLTARVPKLALDKKMSAAAQARVEDMIKKNYFGHISPEGENLGGFLKSSGYRFGRAGENIARQYMTADSLMNAWLTSPGHRQNLLNSAYTDTGIGIAYGEIGGKKGWFVVQLFGTKL